MQTKPLGNSGLQIPVICQGTTGTGPISSKSIERDQHRVKILQYGIELGMNFIDTAELYGGGHAEEVVGEAIHGRRDQVLVASKFNPAHSSKENVRTALESSLARLKTDYIDLYQIHWPSNSIPFEETLRVLEDLICEGKIRWIGLSNFTLNELKAVSCLSKNIVSLQMEYSIIERTIETEILPFCESQSLSIIAYSALNTGGLILDKHRALLDELGQNYQKSPFQMMLKWLISKPGVVIAAKTTSFEHTEANAQVGTFEIKAEDLQLMDETFKYCIKETPIDQIHINPQGKNVYTTIEEAKANPLDLIPAPTELAERILRYDIQKPVWLKPITATDRAFEYDLIREQIFYWAWVIAYNKQRPIPSYILQ